jgi:hypothetical protein
MAKEHPLNWITQLLDWLDPPMLVCTVRFTAGGPLVDAHPPFSTQTTIVVGTSGVPNEVTVPTAGPLDPLIRLRDGLHLSVTRPGGATAGVSVICSLFPIPDTLLRFRLHGSFASPEGPQGPDDQWAPTVVARGGADGVDPTIEILNTANARPVGATHQTRGNTSLGGGWITLGAGVATNQNPSPSNTSTWVSYQDAYDAHDRVFELEADIDCYALTGSGVLTTSPVPDHTWHSSRPWNHPYAAPRKGGGSSGIIGIGVGLGIASVTGTAQRTATVVAKELRVYHWVGSAPWWRRLIEALGWVARYFPVRLPISASSSPTKPRSGAR